MKALNKSKGSLNYQEFVEVIYGKKDVHVPDQFLDDKLRL